jgi:hypothetical protein
MNQTMADERRNLRSNKPGVFLRRNEKLFRVMTEIPTPSLPVKFQFERIGQPLPCGHLQGTWVSKNFFEVLAGYRFRVLSSCGVSV